MAFKDIIGQDRAVNILLKTMQRGRVPSSYLFSGESGIGKKLTAINLAKALNCLGSEQSLDGNDVRVTSHDSRVTPYDCCDECFSCKKINSGFHPDFLVISPEGGLIKIEEIRSIDGVLSLKAFEGRYKVVIVDDADSMNMYAANAFLKTLEEPPENSLIILISSNPERLPDTIRSRCSRINFTPLSRESCQKVIETVINRQSGDKIQPKGKKDEAKKKRSEKGLQPSALSDPGILPLLVRLSMGRPGHAVSRDLIEEREWHLSLLKEMLNGEKDGWASKEEMEKWFDLMLIMIRDIAVIKVTQDETNLINIDLREFLQKISNSMDIKGIIENYHFLSTLRGYFYFNLNKSLTWNYTGSLLRKSMDITYA